MFKSVKTIKNYYTLTGIKFKYVFFEFLLLLIPSILSIISTVLSANIISALTVYDFSLALIYLSWDFGFIVISAVSYFGYHLLSREVCKTISLNLNEYIYQNIKQNNSVNRVGMSAMSGVNDCINFNKDLLYKSCFFIKSIVVLFIIVYYNLIIGMIIFAVSLLSYALLTITNKKIQSASESQTKMQQSNIELFNSILSGIKQDKNPELEDRLKKKYFARVEENVKLKNRISILYGVNNNFITLVLKSAVFGLTVYLIFLVKSTALTLSLYLILTPYLSSSAQNLISFLELFPEISLIENTLTEFENLRFKVTLQDQPPAEPAIDNFNLYFYHTTYKNNNLKCKKLNNINKNKQLNTKNISPQPKFSLQNSFTKTSEQEDVFSPKCGAASPILDLNLKIDFGQMVSFVGVSGSGTETIFKLLERELNTSEGSIFLDHKNIAEIDPRTYRQLVSFTSGSPQFFNISIIENLLLVCESKKKILKELAACNLKLDVETLSQGINTVVNESFNKKLLFFLGIFRCYISGAKIINILGVPPDLNFSEIRKLEKLLLHIRGKCSIITFGNSDLFYGLSNTTYYIKDSKISSTVSLSKRHKKEG